MQTTWAHQQQSRGAAPLSTHLTLVHLLFPQVHGKQTNKNQQNKTQAELQCV